MYPYASPYRPPYPPHAGRAASVVINGNPDGAKIFGYFYNGTIVACPPRADIEERDCYDGKGELVVHVDAKTAAEFPGPRSKAPSRKAPSEPGSEQLAWMGLMDALAAGIVDDNTVAKLGYSAPDHPEEEETRVHSRDFAV
ncbi:hypothetical protein H2203_000728 [Taxawa tesnikishii (nom. ined.)]|nr:hypothetical protein H2203_000728 [Dothideales sp. JES 119]